MHPKTLFRLLLKLVGVCLVIFGLLGLTSGVAQILAEPDTALIGANMSWVVRRWTYIAVELAAGLHLFFRPNWIVDAAFSTPHPCCPHCTYPLQTDQARCPECGAEIPSTSQDDKPDDKSPDAD